MATLKNNEILRVEALTKYYKNKCVLNGISFSVNKGETLAITGRSGAGKSTLLGIIGALDKPNSGNVLFENKILRPRDFRKYRRDNVGFLFQDSSLVEEYTVYENVLAAIKLSKSDADALEYLRLVGLEDKKNVYPNKLSGGQCRLVALARALAKKPALLLLDEPTEGLDDITGAQIIDLMLELCARDGITVIMVTHNMSHAMRMQRRLRLEDGTVSEVLV